MKRLLCILSGMNAGGAETFLMKIYRNIDRTKYQFDFCINVKEKCFYEDEILMLGGMIYRIPSKSENFKDYKSQLTTIIKDNDYNYVLRITSSAMGFMDLKIAKKAGAQICCARSSNASDGNGIKSKLCHRLGRLIYNKYVDVKIAPSDLAAIHTFGKNSYLSGKVSILHNALDLDVFYFDKNRRNLVRKELGIPDDVKIIGHIGRFTEQKNHMFLADIFKAVHDLEEHTALLVVGEGPLESTFKKKIEDLGLDNNVIFAGVRSDIPCILSAMDVFVMPSFYEGMPNTVIEAQATGLPCVIADTITNEADITGLVNYMSLGCANSWAKKVLSVVDSERADTHSNFIKHRYDITSVVDDFVKLVFTDKNN